MNIEDKGIRAYGYDIGRYPVGERNAITDVKGVTVGQVSRISENHSTGVTVIKPAEGNVYLNKVVAASYVLNGYGKTSGLVQVDELGTIETPIALTNTLNVGLVSDALVEYTIRECRKDGYFVTTINPVVGETNDSRINFIQERAVTEDDVLAALDQASEEVAQGVVGAGCGTTCFGLKGGIGTSSRKTMLAGETFTVGALVQSNFGSTRNLRIGTDPVGERIAEKIEEAKQDKGSIMMVLATDAPLSDRQLKRLLKRAAVGLVRTGSFMGHGSGDIMIGFTTANRKKQVDEDEESACICIKEVKEDLLDSLFEAAAEAVEEAILNSLAEAHQVKALNGETVYSLGDFLERKR